jgi:hypothetical protein
MLQVTTTVSDIPVIGEVTSKTRAVTLVDLSYQPKDEKITGEGEVCTVHLDSGSTIVKTTLPPRFAKTVPKPRINAHIRKKGKRYTFDNPRRTYILGAKLDNPETDSLPTEPDDARVTDPDKDNRPGVTVWVSGLVSGQVYVVQRNWTHYLGDVLSDSRIEGKIRFGSRQQVLDASSWHLKSAPAEPRADFAQSYFILVKLAPSSTCQDAVSQAALWKRSM